MSLYLKIPKRDFAIPALFLAIAIAWGYILQLQEKMARVFFYYSVEETGFHKNVLTHYIN